MIDFMVMYKITMASPGEVLKNELAWLLDCLINSFPGFIAAGIVDSNFSHHSLIKTAAEYIHEQI